MKRSRFRNMTFRERIEIVIEFYHSRGINSERVNKVYIKIVEL